MVGGNTEAKLVKRTEGQKNAMGVMTPGTAVVATLTGWLDLMGGDSRYTLQSAKARESTHIFLTDWQVLPATEQEARLQIGGDLYDVMLIDDPMNMHEHLEVYLKYIGPA